MATTSWERPAEFFSIHAGASSSHEGELRSVGAARREGVPIGNCCRTPPQVHAESSRDVPAKPSRRVQKDGYLKAPQLLQAKPSRTKTGVVESHLAICEDTNRLMRTTVRTDAVDLNVLAVVRLRKICSAEGIKVGGLKEDLMRRIQDNFLD